VLRNDLYSRQSPWAELLTRDEARLIAVAGELNQPVGKRRFAVVSYPRSFIAALLPSHPADETFRSAAHTVLHGRVRSPIQESTSDPISMATPPDSRIIPE